MELKFKRLVIAGAGSAYWTIVALCRELGDSIPIEVYDDDTFDGGNGFRRLPRTVDKSTYKVNHLKTFIGFVMGDTSPRVHIRKLLPAELLTGDWTETLVVDATDMDRDSREEFWRALKANGSTGIRLALDGNGIATVSPGLPMIALDSTLQGYGITPNQGQVFRAAGQGAEAIIYALRTGKILEFQTFVPTFENPSIEIGEIHAHSHSHD